MRQPPAKSHIPINRRKPSVSQADSRSRDRKIRLFALLRCFSSTHLRNALRWLFRASLLLLVVAGLTLLVVLVERHARTSPHFAIRNISISGRKRIPQEEIEETMGIAIGDNIFTKSPKALQEALEAHPWISQASVRRRLPHTIEVHITEREPLLLIELDTLYLVDKECSIFKAREDGDPIDLPILRGIDRNRFHRERVYRSEITERACRLVEEWERMNATLGDHLSEIYVQPDGSLVLFTSSDGLELRVGHPPYRPKFLRLARILNELQRYKRRPLYVYLDNVRHPERVTLRLR
ncbi:MAG: FtsQ-type POTRA domain-containing protein [Sandaracinaceae bacterium]|nr:FtsQ-type POTRA domain-containing protein [Sandaracinaceae bacterium]